MTSPKQRYKPGILFWLMLALALGLLLVILWRPGSTLAFDSEPARDFGADWVLLDEDNQPLQALQLPTQVETNETVRLSKIIPKGVGYPAVIGFRSAHQKVRLFCNDTLLYSFGYENQPAFGKSPGAAWNLVRLPQNCEGQTLLLELDSPYSLYQGRIHGMQLGSKAALLFSLLNQHSFPLVLTLVIFSIGVGTLLVYTMVLRKDAGIGVEMLHLGMFAIFISCWLFGECRLTQFFGIPPAFNTCFTFVAMLATPIPLCNYIACSRVHPRGKLLLAQLSRALAVLFVCSICLQALGIFDFIEQLQTLHTCLILACLVMLYTVILDAIHHHGEGQYQLLISLAVLAAFFFLETFLIYFGNGSVGGMMRIGVLTFIALQARTAFQNASHMLRLSRLATVDVLTNCLNRTAYEQSLQEWNGQEAIGVIIADINNLKWINDTYGHAIGDDAIVRCARCFTDAFSPFGRCFRIGGDEFAMLGLHLTEDNLNTMEASFAEQTRQAQTQLQYPFVVSFGHTLYDPHSDLSLADAVRRADKMMYAHKRRLKMESGADELSAQEDS